MKKRSQKILKYTAIFEPAEEGGFETHADKKTGKKAVFVLLRRAYRIKSL